MPIQTSSKIYIVCSLYMSLYTMQQTPLVSHCSLKLIYCELPPAIKLAGKSSVLLHCFHWFPKFFSIGFSPYDFPMFDCQRPSYGTFIHSAFGGWWPSESWHRTGCSTKPDLAACAVLPLGCAKWTWHKKTNKLKASTSRGESFLWAQADSQKLGES